MAVTMLNIYFPYRGNARQHEPCKEFYFMETEIWKDVVGYEGLYQVSSLGRVKSRYLGGRQLKISSHVRGYYMVTLVKCKNKNAGRIHRLVASAFIENPENKPCVNHKNGLTYDNRAENLEWCTYSENMHHSYDKLSRKSDNTSHKITLQISLDGFLIGVYNSRKEAANVTGAYVEGIIKCIKGEYKKSGGYVWA